MSARRPAPQAHTQVSRTIDSRVASRAIPREQVPWITKQGAPVCTAVWSSSHNRGWQKVLRHLFRLLFVTMQQCPRGSDRMFATKPSAIGSSISLSYVPTTTTLRCGKQSMAETGTFEGIQVLCLCRASSRHQKSSLLD